MYPSRARPSSGRFVRDQVTALSAIAGVDVEVFAFVPRGAASYARAAARLRRRHSRSRFDVVHAHYGLSGWVSLALRGMPHVVTFHGTDLEHPLVGPSSRALARLVADRKSTRLNSSHANITYAVSCLKKTTRHTNR